MERRTTSTGAWGFGRVCRIASKAPVVSTGHRTLITKQKVVISTRVQTPGDATDRSPRFASPDQ